MPLTKGDGQRPQAPVSPERTEVKEMAALINVKTCDVGVWNEPNESGEALEEHKQNGSDGE